MSEKERVTPGKPLKLVHCTIGTGDGGGIARMDTFYHRFLNRDIVDPLFVVTTRRNPEEIPYDDSIPYHFIGDKNRFNSLLSLFGSADIVQFSGGFEPVVCEAAHTAQTPIIIEIMHLTEPGQLFGYIDTSICVSESVKKAQFHPDRTVTIHNGVDLSEFPFREGKKEEPSIILLESTRREKNMGFHLDELADDLLPLDDRIELWMAGRSQNGESTSRVRFLGLRSDIANLYRKSDIMVLFSIKEPFGLVVIEAMASGAIPLVADDGGMAEIITHGVDGWLVSPTDKQAIIETVKEALAVRDTPRWEEMRRAARLTVENRFSGLACVRQYEEVYLDLYRRKGRRLATGPVNVAPTPEANCGEALFQFNDNSWEGVAEVTARLAAQEEPLTVKPCATVFLRLAEQAFATGHGGIAEEIYRKLYLSGFRDKDWLLRWIELIDDNVLAGKVAEEVMAIDPYDEKVVMLVVERQLEIGATALALDTLKDSVTRIPGSTALKEVYGMLSAKLGQS